MALAGGSWCGGLKGEVEARGMVDGWMWGLVHQQQDGCRYWGGRRRGDGVGIEWPSVERHRWRSLACQGGVMGTQMPHSMGAACSLHGSLCRCRCRLDCIRRGATLSFSCLLLARFAQTRRSRLATRCWQLEVAKLGGQTGRLIRLSLVIAVELLPTANAVHSDRETRRPDFSKQDRSARMVRVTSPSSK